MEGRDGGRDSSGVWDAHVHTALFKKDNQQGPTVQHREICSMLCSSLDGRGVQGRISLVQLLSRVRVFVTPGLQHAMLPCPSPTPRVYSNSCPSRWWCHPTISSSVIPFLSEKAMAPHSSALAWKIPWTEEPDRLQSMGSLRVGHDWATSLSLFPFMHWRRKWQPTPVFLPGESQGRGSQVGCRLWGRTELDTTEAT